MYDYSLPKRNKQKISVKLFLIILLLFLAIVILPKVFSRKKLDSPLDEATVHLNSTKDQNQLLAEIKELISQKTGSYSIYVTDFKNTSFGINENIIITAASTNKIEILSVLYYLVDQGEVDLDDSVTLQEDDIKEGTGSLRYQPTGTVYSIKTLARLMMEQSDNTAAYLIGNQIIGLDKIQQIIEKWGLTQTNMVENKTSNTDKAKIMQMIYEEKIAGTALTKEMLDFMDDSDFEDRIPALLPKNISIYHKIGNEIKAVHDVGIVNLADKPYYLGVLSIDNPDEADSINTIAKISKLVFDYFNN